MEIINGPSHNRWSGPGLNQSCKHVIKSVFYLSLLRPPPQSSCWSSSSRWEMWSLCEWLETRLSQRVLPSWSLSSRILLPELWPSTESCSETGPWSMQFLLRLTRHNSFHFEHIIPFYFISFRVNHSNNAIVKPPELTPQAAAKELESVMKRVREAQSTIAAAIEPGRFWFDVYGRKIMTLCSDAETASLDSSGHKEAFLQSVQKGAEVSLEVALPFALEVAQEKVPFETQVTC